MKNMIKRVSSLVLALVLVMSLGITAYAADSVIRFKGVKKGFGFAPGSEYTTSDLFDGFKNVMPGDHLEEKIYIENDAKDCDYIKVYLRVETDHMSEKVAAEEKSVATMQDFLKQLTMRIYNEGELIYEHTADQEGSLADFVYLGKLRSGKYLDLKVELDVPIELGNEYANRVGEVDWVILAECYNDPDELIQTGQLNWPIPVLGSLGILMVFCGFLMMRKKKKNEDA